MPYFLSKSAPLTQIQQLLADSVTLSTPGGFLRLLLGILLVVAAVWLLVQPNLTPSVRVFLVVILLLAGIYLFLSAINIF